MAQYTNFVPFYFKGKKTTKNRIERIGLSRKEANKPNYTFKDIMNELLEAALDLPEYKKLLTPTPTSSGNE